MKDEAGGGGSDSEWKLQKVPPCTTCCQWVIPTVLSHVLLRGVKSTWVASVFAPGMDFSLPAKLRVQGLVQGLSAAGFLRFPPLPFCLVKLKAGVCCWVPGTPTFAMLSGKTESRYLPLGS